LQKNNMPAPTGNQNASIGKKWKAAIDRALEARSKLDQKHALDALAEKLLQRCDEGDLTALKELGDRIDGKAVQGVDLAGSVEVTSRLIING
jgi:hypothetical protein